MNGCLEDGGIGDGGARRRVRSSKEDARDGAILMYRDSAEAVSPRYILG